MTTNRMYHPTPISTNLNVVSPAEKNTDSLLVRLSIASKTPVLGEPTPSIGDIVLNQNGQKNYLMVSLGTDKSPSDETFRRAGSSLVKWLKKYKVDQAVIDLTKIPALTTNEQLFALCEGIFLGAYKFLTRKSNSKSLSLTKIDFVVEKEQEKTTALLEKARIISEAVYLARDWAHEPANIINPLTLSERTNELAKQNNQLNFKVLDEAALKKIHANAIVSVGKASKTPSRLIILEYPGYNPPKNAKPIVILGKAITFDTGGYSLKDKKGILGMKYDKCGGVNVAAVLQAAAALKIKTPIVGIIAAAENMISSEAYRPDDIITSLSGKTIEIISTDAEGRMVLADALTYAQQEYQPRAMIDMATLTGGVVVALGRVRGGLFSNNDKLAEKLMVSADKKYERMWQLPLDDDYAQLLNSTDADLKNAGGREGHPIIAGVFLKQFVNDDVPWAHLDIAGVAHSPKSLPYSSKGATGFGVRLLLDFLENLEAE